MRRWGRGQSEEKNFFQLRTRPAKKKKKKDVLPEWETKRKKVFRDLSSVISSITLSELLVFHTSTSSMCSQRSMASGLGQQQIDSEKNKNHCAVTVSQLVMVYDWTITSPLNFCIQINKYPCFQKKKKKTLITPLLINTIQYIGLRSNSIWKGSPYFPSVQMIKKNLHPCSLNSSTLLHLRPSDYYTQILY